MAQWAFTGVQKLISRAFHHLLGPRAELQELTCVFYALSWGTLLLTTDGAHANPVLFAQMAAFAPDRVWGLLLTALGGCGLVAYVTDIVRARRILAMMGVFGWTLISYLLLRSYCPVVSTVAVPTCAVMSALTYVRLGGKV